MPLPLLDGSNYRAYARADFGRLGNGTWLHCLGGMCNGTHPAPAAQGMLDPNESVASSCDADPNTCGCDSAKQADYRGKMAVTQSGLACQRWDSQLPHSHSRTPGNRPSAGLEENYCRNPDGESMAWCYYRPKYQVGVLQCPILSCIKRLAQGLQHHGRWCEH